MHDPLLIVQLWRPKKRPTNMDKKTIGDWIMYYEVQRLQREGLSYPSIAKALVMNRRTVVKYAAMSEAEYEGFLEKKDSRAKLLGSCRIKLAVHYQKIYKE